MANLWKEIEHGRIKRALRRWRPYRTATYAGIAVSYKAHLDGGGSTHGQDFIPMLHRRGMPKQKRVFEWCAGPGFIGFSLLAHGLAETLCLADVTTADVFIPIVADAGLKTVFVQGCAGRRTADTHVYYVGVMRPDDPPPGWAHP
jgi:hypothetical protein